MCHSSGVGLLPCLRRVLSTVYLIKDLSTWAVKKKKKYKWDQMRHIIDKLLTTKNENKVLTSANRKTCGIQKSDGWLLIKTLKPTRQFKAIPKEMEKAMAPHSSTFAWKIPWMEEPGRLQSMGSLESDTTEHLHLHFSLSCIGEGNGNPLQCSCLENPRDGEAWWAAVSGVTKSWTWLKRLSSSSKVLKENCQSKIL